MRCGPAAATPRPWKKPNVLLTWSGCNPPRAGTFGTLSPGLGVLRVVVGLVSASRCCSRGICHSSSRRCGRGTVPRAPPVRLHGLVAVKLLTGSAAGLPGATAPFLWSSWAVGSSQEALGQLCGETACLGLTALLEDSWGYPRQRLPPLNPPVTSPVALQSVGKTAAATPAGLEAMKLPWMVWAGMGVGRGTAMGGIWIRMK